MADSTQDTLSEQYDHSESAFDPALDLPLETIPDSPVAKPASGPTTPAPASSGPPKTPRKHLPGLVRRALAHGASREEIDAATPSDLDSWVEEQDIARERSREQNFHAAATGNAMDSQRRQSAPAPAEPDDEAELDAVAQEYGLDAKFVNIIKRQAKELRELKGTLKGTVERSQSREKQERDAAYDMAFEQTGKKFAKVFGEGDGAELVGSKELARRNAVIKSANIQDTDTPTVIRRKVAKAADALYGDIVGSAPAEDQGGGPYDGSGEVDEESPLPRGNIRPNGKGRITPEQWNNGTLAKPTQRATKEKKGREVAIRKVHEQITQNPDTYGDFESFEEDGLPE